MCYRTSGFLARDGAEELRSESLDYYWEENEPKEVQKKVFLEQIDLAKQFDLPIIIHDRDAHGDMLELFQKEVSGVQAVFHCYAGSVEMAKELVKRGYYFGFGVIVLILILKAKRKIQSTLLLSLHLLKSLRQSVALILLEIVEKSGMALVKRIIQMIHMH